MSQTFVVTKQQKEMLVGFLEKVDEEIAPNKILSGRAAEILGLHDENIESGHGA